MQAIDFDTALIYELSRKHQIERDGDNWRSFRSIAADALVGVFEAAEQANNPPPPSIIEDYITLILEESFTPQMVIGENLKSKAKTAALEALQAARAGGSGWRDACNRARAVPPTGGPRNGTFLDLPSLGAAIYPCPGRIRGRASKPVEYRRDSATPAGLGAFFTPEIPLWRAGEARASVAGCLYPGFRPSSSPSPFRVETECDGSIPQCRSLSHVFQDPPRPRCARNHPFPHQTPRRAAEFPRL